MSSNEIAELVEKVRNKDNDAWAKLYSATLPRAMYTASRFVRNTTEAEDIVQDSYISAWNHLDSLKDSTKFQPWLDRIVANRCKNRLEKKDPVLFSDMMICDDEGEETEPEFENRDISFMPAENLDIKETKRIVGEVIDSLPADQKMTVTLFYMDENSIADIAETMRCSEGTVKSRLNRARASIKEQILIIEKRDGIKLSSIPLAVLLVSYFNADTTAYAATFGGVSAAGASVAVSEGFSATGTTTSVTSGAVTTKAASIASKAVGTKIAAGVLAVALVGGGALAANSAVTQKNRIFELAEEEQEVLTELYQYVEQDDFRKYEKIMWCMEDNKDILNKLYIRYKDEVVSFDGEAIKKEYTGKGVAVSPEQNVWYIGDLQNGVPSGKGYTACITAHPFALSQDVELYGDVFYGSFGEWADGRLTGHAVTISRGPTMLYSKDDKNYLVEMVSIKEGEFLDDFMNGTVEDFNEHIRRNKNWDILEVRPSRYQYEVSNGRYVINDRWYISNSDNKIEYRLPSKDGGIFTETTTDKLDRYYGLNLAGWKSIELPEVIQDESDISAVENKKDVRPQTSRQVAFDGYTIAFSKPFLIFDKDSKIEEYFWDVTEKAPESAEEKTTEDQTELESNEAETIETMPDRTIKSVNDALPLLNAIFEVLWNHYYSQAVTDTSGTVYKSCDLVCDDLTSAEKFVIALCAGDGKNEMQGKPPITTEEVKKVMDAIFGENTVAKAEEDGVNIYGLNSRGDSGEGTYPMSFKVKKQDGYSIIYGKTKDDYSPDVHATYELWLRPVEQESEDQAVEGFVFERFVFSP